MRILTANGVGALAVLVVCIVGCGLARVWLVLAVVHLDASPAAAALAFAALGVLVSRPSAPRRRPGRCWWSPAGPAPAPSPPGWP